MNALASLKNHVLVAMPTALKTSFEHAVIYVCEHQTQGSVGLMINRPMEFQLGFVFDQLSIESISVQQKHKPLLYGGPLQTDRGFVIHRPGGHWNSSLQLGKDVTITTSNDIIRAFARDDGPKEALVTLGFVGWSSEQLAQELKDNVWLVCPYDSALLYDIPFDQRWVFAASTIGVNMDRFIQGGGHA